MEMEVPETLVRMTAIIAIAGLEYALIVSGQDGSLLLPVCALIGFIARGKLPDLKELFTKGL